jgi:flagellar basal body-associated protein FliL
MPGSLRLIAIGVVGIFVGVLAAFFLLRGTSPAPTAERPARAQASEYEGPNYRIKERVYNLQDPNARRYVKLGLTLQFSAETAKYKEALGEEYAKLSAEFEKELEPKKDFINDALTTVISSKTMAQLLEPEGKERLKQEIAQRINAANWDHPKVKVLQVYFTDFVIQ